VSSHRLSERAYAELIDIYLAGLELFGPKQALAYQVEFEECFAVLARFPGMGRAAERIGPGLRRHEHGAHVILYQEEDDGILVVAVVHGRSIRSLRV